MVHIAMDTMFIKFSKDVLQIFKQKKFHNSSTVCM
jgi:hypothetical protein